MISVIIPFYKNWSNLTSKRLIELYTYFDPCQIVLVNDAGEEDISSFVAYWQKMVGKHEIIYAKNKENRGFGYSMNRGAKVATGDVLMFLSNDVEIKNNFGLELEGLIQENDPCLVGAELLQHDTGWNNFNGVVVPYLNGWLLACSRNTWNKLGGFDLRYGKADFEDVDLSYTASMWSMPLLQLNNAKVRHLGGQSFGYNPERAELTKRNRKTFAEKWNLL